VLTVRWIAGCPRLDWTRVSQPFFIIGTGRCGSTYLFDVLQAHENVCLTNEPKVVDFLYFMCRYAALPVPQRATFGLHADVELYGIIRPDFTERFATILTAHTRQILEEFHRGMCPDKDVTHWGEKLPSGQAAGAVKELFPATRYVVLIRDPRDVYCSSLAYARRTVVRELSPFIDFESVDEFCRYWAQTYRGALTWLRDVHLVRYEDLVRTPVRVVEGILEHLRLAPSEAVFAAATENTNYIGHGTSGTPARSIGRWRRELDPSDLERIEELCGELMDEHGYERAGS
jgi:hypothetical protein